MRQILWRRKRRLIIGMILFAFIPCGGCLQTASFPPSPDAPAETAAREAVVNYAHRLADSFDEAGSQLQSGTLKSAVDVNQHLQAANVAARKQAFQKLDELLNAELGGEKWDAARAEQIFQHISTGLRSLP